MLSESDPKQNIDGRQLTKKMQRPISGRLKQTKQSKYQPNLNKQNIDDEYYNQQSPGYNLPTNPTLNSSKTNQMTSNFRIKSSSSNYRKSSNEPILTQDTQDILKTKLQNSNKSVKNSGYHESLNEINSIISNLKVKKNRNIQLDSQYTVSGHKNVQDLYSQNTLNQTQTKNSLLKNNQYTIIKSNNAQQRVKSDLNKNMRKPIRPTRRTFTNKYIIPAKTIDLNINM